MDTLANMVWVELIKAIRSRVPIWTALGSLMMPLGIAFLIFVSKNPEFSQKLGLISVKADLLKYSATDWPAYLQLSGQLIAAGGFFLFILVISWIFGREFADGTLTDMWAVPVRRSSILLSKFIVAAIWSAALTLVILVASLTTGAILKLPGGSLNIILQYSTVVLTAACLVMAVVTPFALLASIGRGYLLPMGLAVLLLMLANLVAVIGWGQYFPWAVPGLYLQGIAALSPVSFWIVSLTGLAGILATYFWWKYTDQNR